MFAFSETDIAEIGNHSVGGTQDGFGSFSVVDKRGNCNGGAMTWGGRGGSNSGGAITCGLW